MLLRGDCVSIRFQFSSYVVVFPTQQFPHNRNTHCWFTPLTGVSAVLVQHSFPLWSVGLTRSRGRRRHLHRFADVGNSAALTQRVVVAYCMAEC